MIVTGGSRFNSPGDYLLGTAVDRIIRHSPAPVLQEEISKSGADLVVFGTHGMGGFRRATIGSITSSLLECTIPDALVVPPEERGQGT